MKTYLCMFLVLLFSTLAVKAFANSGSGAVAFDTERGVALYDSDNDTFPDVTESLFGTDPNNPDSHPGSASGSPSEGETFISTRGGFPDYYCRSDYRQVDKGLCISWDVQGPHTYPQAAAKCHHKKGRVATFEDFSYLFIYSHLDADYNPKGKWIGNMVANNKVLCGNRHISSNNDPDIKDFEGECNKKYKKEYWCVHDRE